jgi:hypothetical protein
MNAEMQEKRKLAAHIVEEGKLNTFRFYVDTEECHEDRVKGRIRFRSLNAFSCHG